MPPALLFAFVALYFAAFLAIAWATSRGAGNDAFFVGNRASHWMLVAFGMVGTSLSGVTFVSVPGAVGATGFTYAQIILGHVVGYAVIALVLLPIYYRERVVSVYRYLETRLGPRSHRTGAAFFIASRTLGATARLYLVVRILQDAALDGFGVPFWLTATVVVAMILAYTYEGGVKTIVWTDTLQTACMLLGLAICTGYVLYTLNIDVPTSLELMRQRGLSTLVETDWKAKHFFAKDFIAGIFIAVAMTGLDQEMMQKNISVRTLRDSQKNVFMLSLVMLAVVMLFLYFGGLLYLYAPAAGVQATGDRLFPSLVFGHFPAFVQAVFVLALISALFPSADGALTALTSSFCIDILGIRKRDDLDEAARKRIRHRVHLAFAALFLALVAAFRIADNPSMIDVILHFASYTYGPLLGLFAFGILTDRVPDDRKVPWIAIAAPLLCFAIEAGQRALFGGYEVGLELLAVNGLFTFIGLWMFSLESRR